MKILTVVSTIPQKHTVELVDENKDVVYWKLGTGLSIENYKIGTRYKVYKNIIEELNETNVQK